MITPSVSVEDWVDELNKQVRPESNIQIDVYSVSGGVCSLLKTIDKSNIESFNIRESGSVLGFDIPSVDISFSVFKDADNTQDYFKVGRFIRISYGFFIDSDWEWAIKGVYEISRVSMPSNGLVAKVEANFLRYQALEQQWTYGGIATPLGNYPFRIKDYIQKWDSNLIVNYDYGSVVISGGLNGVYPQLGNQSVLSLIRSLCQVNRCSYRIKGFINASNHYGITIQFIDNRTSPYGGDYSVNYFNQYKKPETIDDGSYKYDHFVIKEYLISLYTQSPDSLNTISFLGSKVNGSFCEQDYSGKEPAQDEATSFVVKDENGATIVGVYTITGKLYYGGAVLSSSPTIPNNYSVEMTYKCIVENSDREYGWANNNYITIDNPFVSSSCDLYTTEPHTFDHVVLNKVEAMFFQYMNSNMAELDYRIDPRMEILDVIEYEKPDHTYSKGFIEEYSMSYKGSYKGTMTILLTGDREYYISFENYYTEQVLQDGYYYYGDTPTYDGATPTYTLTNNACYSSAVFVDWDEPIEPATQDWTYVATYNFTLRNYTQVSTIGHSTAYYQMVQYNVVQDPLQTNKYRKIPKVVMLYDLPVSSSNAKNVLNAGNGAILIENTSAIPTTFSSNNGGGDDWQYNYWRIEAGSSALTQRVRVRNSKNPTSFLYLCETNGKLWLSTSSSNAKQWTLGTDISQYFEYDSVNDKFVYYPNGANTPISGIYKRD